MNGKLIIILIILITLLICNANCGKTDNDSCNTSKMFHPYQIAMIYNNSWTPHLNITINYLSHSANYSHDLKVSDSIVGQDIYLKLVLKPRLGAVFQIDGPVLVAEYIMEIKYQEFNLHFIADESISSFHVVHIGDSIISSPLKLGPFKQVDHLYRRYGLFWIEINNEKINISDLEPLFKQMEDSGAAAQIYDKANYGKYIVEYDTLNYHYISDTLSHDRKLAVVFAYKGNIERWKYLFEKEHDKYKEKGYELIFKEP